MTTGKQLTRGNRKKNGSLLQKLEKYYDDGVCASGTCVEITEETGPIVKIPWRNRNS